MRCPAGPPPPHSGPGFTLIELLLVVVLVMLLMGAVIFNFSSLTENAALDEGATRIETIFRFARAQAANTGRKVRVVFDESAAADPAGSPVAVRIEWEPDPLERPGEFQNLPESALDADQVFDTIRVENLEVDDGTMKATEETGSPEDEDAMLFEEMFGQAFPPITFLPDGSSDSAQLTLVSPESDPPRRLRLQLNGITGAMFREALTAEGEESLEADWEALTADLPDSPESLTP